MNHLKNLTERVVCPFDPVHVVERRRFQQHLIKCERNLPKNHDFVQCQFWHLHYVRRSELNDHLESCEHKLAKEANKKSWLGDAQTRFFQPKLKYNDIPSTELESWDDATLTAPTFSSEIMIAKANYMTVPQGLSKSKRKEFREKERERLREREEKEKVFVAKGEKNQQQLQTETILPPPRKPTENPVKRLGGRIAAKFSAPKENAEESKELFSPARSSRNGSGAGSTPTIGRGRGLLGWSHITEPERAFHFSPEEFPNL